MPWAFGPTIRPFLVSASRRLTSHHVMPILHGMVIQVRDIDADLWRKVRAKAIAQNLSIRQLLETLLRQWLKA